MLIPAVITYLPSLGAHRAFTPEFRTGSQTQDTRVQTESCFEYTKLFRAYSSSYKRKEMFAIKMDKVRSFWT